MAEVRVRDVVAVLDGYYPPALAQPWDAVGLCVGDPDAAVERVLFAVDPAAVVVEEAVEREAQLLITHHPLLLRGVHGVAEDAAKGRLVARLIRSGIALFTAHTNADSAAPGVSDALADALGLRDTEPLDPVPPDPLDQLVVYVPHDDAERLLDVLAAAGAGAVGDYTRCAFSSAGIGTFTPAEHARPAIGTPGERASVEEVRLELVLPRARRRAVVRAMRAAHPYEEPAYGVWELALPPGSRGLGRVGRLATPEPLSTFLLRARAALPTTKTGLRATGAPERVVERVAVCGGAGDSLLDAVRATGADVYLTADLRHHPSSELIEEGGPALVDAAHWATEWPWLLVAADRLHAALDTVAVAVSTRVTDPWALRID